MKYHFKRVAHGTLIFDFKSFGEANTSANREHDEFLYYIVEIMVLVTFLILIEFCLMFLHEYIYIL